ncbi:MAG: succinate dehydrogenase iron-sulfur subunit [Dehalococcoidia bacterium]|nr:succinate dehydrogenase iron-sulfur subunit [Dehalococcoidia bacterium]
MEARFQIQRFDPEADKRPYDKTYEVTLAEGATILDGLLQIKDEMDGTLSFRRSCRSAICGSCAVRVNGHAVLACKTQIEPHLRNGVLKVSPIGNMRVIKDLVVDMTPFWQQVRGIQPWLSTKPTVPERENVVDMKLVQPLFKPAQCIMCASCYSDCNVVDSDKAFAGPAALAKGYRFVADVRDNSTSDRIKRMSAARATWECSRCYTCVEVCPKHVAPLDCISLLRSKTIEAGVTETPGARHVEAFVESVKHTGRLNEVTLPLKTRGLDPKALLSMAPIGIRMLIKGKLPMPFEQPIPNVEEIRRIIETVEENK